MDSRTSSILINLDLNLNKTFVASTYGASKEKIEQSRSEKREKTYKSLKSALKECYFVGSLKYGNNFVM